MMDNQTNNNKLDLPPAPAVPALRQRENDEDIMAMLEARVDPVQEERMRQKAMQFALVGAVEKRDSQKVKQLIEDGVNIDAQIMYTKTPLTHSIELKHGDIAILILENGCDPKLTVNHFPYFQPIHIAAREDLSEVVDKLIELHVDVDACDTDKMTPLILASYYGRTNVVNQLIKNGADINFQDSCDRTPLHRAVESDSIEVIEMLIWNKADMNITDQKGWTPLHLALALNYQEIVNILLENSCNLEISDVNGRTPLCIACDFLSRKNYDIIRATQFSYEARKRDFMQGRYLSLLQLPKEDRETLSMVMALINKGANIDGSQSLPKNDGHQSLPITVAAMADHTGTVQMLINSGAWIPQDWQPVSSVHLGFKMHQLSEWIEFQGAVQLTLSWQCKRTIRKLLATTCEDIDAAINKLSLPPALKMFLR
ncbi:ankyrin-3-like isoform X2 [Mytilus trossulus]|uniref:ankyrin-3-like isoform X2 n=1 Tax=Mytilus trossulus TaxID=6551 RepID=UPI0030061C57